MKRNAYKALVNKPEEKRYLKHLVEDASKCILKKTFKKQGKPAGELLTAFKLALRSYQY